METSARKFNNQTHFLSKKQFDEHYKLYTGYVGKVEEITKDLASCQDRAQANATYSQYRGLKKGETYALDGVILHERYFQLLGGEKTRPGDKTARILEEQFGGFENWKADFQACGLSARGWVIFLYEQRTQTYRNILLDLHDEGLICGGYPLIVMDMYEHAYFIDYGTDKTKYISGFVDAIRWDLVEKAAQIIAG
ncbi:MAG: Fe-Mn family superoxide dismutase [Clostridiales bacterium]|jgi:Fe-Mn family superoxide dismutase|nr:Fe-Mn family superoxide dismutase [Clostridiales bacterium]